MIPGEPGLRFAARLGFVFEPGTANRLDEAILGRFLDRLPRPQQLPFAAAGLQQVARAAARQ